ncbi:hypothetical protein NDA16_002927 [Ustilago loliicola]|nr:hypothetical protein NDA16_002927 [Ustilago loliicola]
MFWLTMKFIKTLSLLAVLGVASSALAAPISTSTTASSNLAVRADANLIDELAAALKDLGLGDAEAKDPNLLDSLAAALKDLGLRKRNLIDELAAAEKDLGLGDAEAKDLNLLDEIAKASADLGL